MGLFSHPSHNDTTGDYAAALEGIIDEPNQLPKELGTLFLFITFVVIVLYTNYHLLSFH